MARVAFLFPSPELCDMIQPMLAEFHHIVPFCIDYIHNDEAEARARQLEQEGCDLIVARGLQALRIQKSTNIPLINIEVTMQELGMFAQELQRELQKEHPVLALIGFSNMFADTTHFEELFGIRLRRYMAHGDSDLIPMTQLAIQEGCDGIIGGIRMCEYARSRGVATRYFSIGNESLHNALVMAELTSRTIDLERRSRAEISLIFNSAHSGLMQIDKEGRILRANAQVFHLLDKSPRELIQHRIQEIYPKLEKRTLDILLGRSQESYATLSDSHRSLVVNSASLEVDGYTDSILLTIEEGQRVLEMDSELRKELYRWGFVAKYTFEKLPTRANESVAINALAKRMAQLNAPVLISGEIGTGKLIMAQCIHNASPQAGNAFVSLDCSAWQADTLDTMLFGNYSSRKDSPACLAELAQDGTLYLSHVDSLPYEIQYKLLNLMQGRFLHNGNNQPRLANVRVIASTNINLIACVDKETFRSDLYYALNVLTLKLQPLRCRREDILGWVEHYLEEWQSKHKRYIHLTDGAKHFLQSYDWPGNLDQVNSVCERIVLLAQKRSVDEVFLSRQLDQIAPKILAGTDSVVIYKDVKAVQLAEVLRRHGGNRKKAAEELGISKTTLWRYMKKYGIDRDLSY